MRRRQCRCSGRSPANSVPSACRRDHGSISSVALRMPSRPRIDLLRRPPRLVAALLPRARLHETLALTAWVARVTPAPPRRRLLVEDDHDLFIASHDLFNNLPVSLMVWWCYGSCCCPLPPAPSTVIGPPGRQASSSASRAPSIPLLQALLRFVPNLQLLIPVTCTLQGSSPTRHLHLGQASPPPPRGTNPSWAGAKLRWLTKFRSSQLAAM